MMTAHFFSYLGAPLDKAGDIPGDIAGDIDADDFGGRNGGGSAGKLNDILGGKTGKGESGVSRTDAPAPAARGASDGCVTKGFVDKFPAMLYGE